jgi:uncharacterized protein
LNERVPQMIERPWGVAAYGAASVKAVPDLVRVRFKVIRLEQSPSQAFASVSAAVHAVREAVRAHRIPDAAVERSRLDLRSSWNGFGADRKFLGYQCLASFALRSGNLDGVQQLLIDIVAAGANEMEAVEFDVTTKPELRAQARREAVAAARSKAELYAEAAGVRLGAVLHIDDVDPEHGSAPLYRGQIPAGGQSSPEDLAPGHVVVTAAVVLGFSISHG